MKNAETIPTMRPVPHSPTLTNHPGGERIDDEDGDCIGHVIDHYRAEMVRRWNIHGTMVAFLERIASRTGQVTPAMRNADLHDAQAILRLYRGV